MAGTINILAGADYQDTILITEVDGTTARDLTGGEIRFKIGLVGDTNAQAQLYTSTEDVTPYVMVTDAAAGEVTVDIPESVTKGFSAGNYLWAVRLKESDSDVFETDTGICIIKEAFHDDET